MKTIVDIICVISLFAIGVYSADMARQTTDLVARLLWSINCVLSVVAANAIVLEMIENGRV